MKNVTRLLLTVFVFTLVALTFSAFGQETNAPAVPTGLDIPGLNLLPPEVAKWLLIVLVLSPFVGRALYSLNSGGGIKGIGRSIWLGTNTPKDKE